MPAKTKIQDAAEVRRWLDEGRTYDWMIQEYGRKYELSVSRGMFSNFRARNGMDRRVARDDDLIPWAVKPEHRWAYPLAMLRVEARRRTGFDLRATDADRLEKWKARLVAEGLVVHYEPGTKQGWWYVPRREGVDKDLIREPDEKTTHRRNADDHPW